MSRQFPYRYRVLILLFFLMCITFLDRSSISVVAVRIKSDLNLSNFQFAWVLAAFAIAYAVFDIPSGRLVDKKGQKAALIRIVLWWSLFTAITGIVTGFISLIIVRFLFGMGEAGAFLTSASVLSRWLPAGELSRGLSLSFVGWSAGAAFAPLIVVPIAMSFGWRATFFVNGLIGLIWVIVCWRWFRNNPAEMKGISETERRLIEENRNYTCHKDKTPWKQILKSRTLLALSFAQFCSQWSAYFFIAWLPQFLQEGRHFSENSMKLTVFLIFLSSIPFSYLCGMWGDWIVKKKGLTFGRRFVGSLSSALISLCLLLVASLSSNVVLFFGLLLAYICQLFFATVAWGVCIDISDNHPGTVGGIMNTLGQIGAVFMAIVFGKILDLTNSYNTPLYVISGMLFCGALACLFLDPARKLRLEDHKISIAEAAAAPPATLID
jgi:MFS family permease